jgi:hypothetical protein
MLTLPWRDQVNQMLGASISIELIERIDPGLLILLSSQKNTGNYLEKLDKLL